MRQARVFLDGDHIVHEVTIGDVVTMRRSERAAGRTGPVKRQRKAEERPPAATGFSHRGGVVWSRGAVVTLCAKELFFPPFSPAEAARIRRMASMKARGSETPPRGPRTASSEARHHARHVGALPLHARGDDRVGRRRGPRSSNWASQDWIAVGYFVAILVALAFGRGPTAAPASSASRRTSAVFLFVLALVRGNVLRWGGAATSLLYRVAIIATLLEHVLPAARDPARGEPVDALDARIYAFDMRVFGFEPSVYFDRLVTPATTEWFAFFYFLYFLILTRPRPADAVLAAATRIFSRFATGVLLMFLTAHLSTWSCPATGRTGT